MCTSTSSSHLPACLQPWFCLHRLLLVLTTLCFGILFVLWIPEAHCLFTIPASASDSLLRGNNKQSYMRVFKEVVKSASEFVVKLLIQLLIMLINVFIHIQTCTVPVHMLLIFWGVLSCISFVYNSLCSPVRGFLSSSLFFAVAKCICNWQAQQSFCCRIKKIIKIRAATCFPVPHFYFYLVS